MTCGNICNDLVTKIIRDFEQCTSFLENKYYRLCMALSNSVAESSSCKYCRIVIWMQLMVYNSIQRLSTSAVLSHCAGKNSGSPLFLTLTDNIDVPLGVLVARVAAELYTRRITDYMLWTANNANDKWYWEEFNGEHEYESSYIDWPMPNYTLRDLSS